MQQSKNIGRRDLLRHGGTATLAIAVAATGAVVVGAADDADLETQIRLFVRSLLSEQHKLTLGQSVERKRVAKTLQALIGDAIEPWQDWEVMVLREQEATVKRWEEVQI